MLHKSGKIFTRHDTHECHTQCGRRGEREFLFLRELFGRNQAIQMNDFFFAHCLNI